MGITPTEKVEPLTLAVIKPDTERNDTINETQVMRGINYTDTGCIQKPKKPKSALRIVSFAAIIVVILSFVLIIISLLMRRWKHGHTTIPIEETEVS